MSEVEIEETPRSFSGALLGAIALAVLCAIGGLIWTYTLSSRIAHQETALAEANQQNAKIQAELRETNARLQVATDEMGKSLGLTQKQLDARANEIVRREAAENRRLDDGPEADGPAGDRCFERSVKREDRCGRSEDRSRQDPDRSGRGGQPAAIDEGRPERSQQPDCAQSRANLRR